MSGWRSEQKSNNNPIKSVWGRIPAVKEEEEGEVTEEANHIDAEKLAMQQQIDEQGDLIDELEAKVKNLEARLQELEDLNLLTPYITNYYVEVFKTLRRENISKHNGMCSFVYQTWVELFTSAQMEMDIARESKGGKIDPADIPLNTMIENCMMRLGDISPKDWDELQKFRKTRNLNGHPKQDDQKAKEAVALRWQHHSAGPTLKKLMTWSCSQFARGSSFGGRFKKFGSDFKRFGADFESRNS